MNNYNVIIDCADVTADSSVTEPLTLQEVKDYLRLEGFIDDSESLSTDFDDDDTLIEELITSCRERLELFTGLSFVPKSYEVELTNLAGYITLPFGPVNDITSVTDVSGTALVYTTTNNLSKLKTPLRENLIVTYDCGYSTLPKGLKEAMLKEIAYRYENRGDIANEGLSQAALFLASRFKEVNTWLG
jgi:hypothetical protein